ncbi:MAG: hypothetical protein OIF40_00005, partial [Mangrovicoccus sp.]|nr:hypothetical protein [Mangrovicoccus sp.]
MSKSASHLAVKSLRVASEFVSLVEPRLRRLAALERHLIENQSLLRFGDEIVQADFEAAKAADASLSKDRYLREKAPEPIRRRIIAQLGEDGFTLMASQDVTEIFRVYAGLLDCCRFRHFDADGGIRLTEVLARLDDAQHGRLWDLIRAKGLPPPLGIRPPRGGTMTWSGHGQPVFWMNFAFAVLNRGRESLFRISTIPNMIGSQPHQLRAQDLHKPAHGMLEHADCTISLHDMILASKGYAPIYGGVVMRGSDLGPKPAGPGGRLHWELALQLSHLTQDPSWLSARGQALSRKIADLRASGEIGGMKPKTTQDFSNPHLRLSAEDCCKMLMEEPGAPRVEYQAMEIEHSLGQRVAGLFDRITNWLGVPERAHQFNA